MVTASKYDQTVDKIVAWSAQEHNTKSAIIILGRRLEKRAHALLQSCLKKLTQ